MVGKICTSSIPFYDTKTKRETIKRRPVLIIAQADSGDYNMLPLSTIPDKTRVDPDFDMCIDPVDYPGLLLKKVSYIRIHKQGVVNIASLSTVSDLKTQYPDLYLDVLAKLDEYNQRIFSNAI